MPKSLTIQYFNKEQTTKAVPKKIIAILARLLNTTMDELVSSGFIDYLALFPIKTMKCKHNVEIICQKMITATKASNLLLTEIKKNEVVLVRPNPDNTWHLEIMCPNNPEVLLLNNQEWKEKKHYFTAINTRIKTNAGQKKRKYKHRAATVWD